MPKYRDYFRRMINEHETEFAEFKRIHDQYAKDQKKWQAEYNIKGKKILEIIRKTESELCGNMERGDKAMFSSNLSEKYWGEVRAFFPMIDLVGAEIS
jgi:hypothetical protein